MSADTEHAHAAICAKAAGELTPENREDPRLSGQLIG
jgi:hypothetical protein